MRTVCSNSSGPERVTRVSQLLPKPSPQDSVSLLSVALTKDKNENFIKTWHLIRSESKMWQAL